MDYPLNTNDLALLLPRVPVLTYPELQGITHIEEVLGPGGKAVILFLTTGLSEGHWTGVFTRGRHLCFFDSYGLAPDAERGWLSHDKLVALQEDVPLLHDLFKNAEARGFNVSYNRRSYQNMHDESETCGRHVAVRLNNSHLNDSEYASFLRQAAQETGAHTPDETVVNITRAVIGK